AGAPASAAQGTYPVTPSAAVGSGLSNYTIGYVDGTLTVGTASTTTAIASSSNPSIFGQSVTFTATVTVVSPASGTPTGTVTFKDGATTLGTGTLDGSGVATLSTAGLSVASHSITAAYAGDTGFTTSTSSALIQVVSSAGTAYSLQAWDKTGTPSWSTS